MGGEYLPNYQPHEVEIARIELQSTTSDVISLRAKGSQRRIKYRLVDEYETEFALLQQTSRLPFSLRELIVFLDSVKHDGADPNWHRFGFPLLSNELNLDGSSDLELLESLRDFTRVSSDFYPELASHYCKVIDDGVPSENGRYGVRRLNAHAEPTLCCASILSEKPTCGLEGKGPGGITLRHCSAINSSN